MATKTNPITGEPIIGSITRLSKMSGYDRKRESEPMQVNARDRMKAEKQANKDLNKSINAGIPTKREMKKEERSQGLKPARGVNSGGTSTTPNRNTSKSGGGKKGYVIKSGKGGLAKQKRGSMDKSCKGPKSWMD